MNDHKFILEPYKGQSTRHTCPGCEVMREFTRYVNTETGEYLAEDVGICNRLNNCGYHYAPQEYFQDNPTTGDYQPIRRKTEAFNHSVKVSSSKKQASRMPFDGFKKSLAAHDRNNFTKWLNGLFGPEITADLIKRFYIGTSTHWQGATIFWQVDLSGGIRAGKIMLFDQTGHRVKKPFDHQTWAHSVGNIKDFKLEQCLFGEHQLIADPDKPIKVCESEKTSIVASVYLPEYTWLATGGADQKMEQI